MYKKDRVNTHVSTKNLMILKKRMERISKPLQYNNKNYSVDNKNKGEVNVRG